MQGFAVTCVQTYIFLCRRKSPLGHESRRANLAMKFMAAIVKKEGRDPPTETKLVKNEAVDSDYMSRLVTIRDSSQLESDDSIVI